MAEGDGNGLKTLIEMLREIGGDARGANERLDRLEPRLDRIEVRQDRMDTRLDRMEVISAKLQSDVATLAQVMMNGFARMDRRMDSFEHRMDRLEQQFDEMQRFLRINLGAIRGALEHDDGRLMAHEDRIKALEAHAADESRHVDPTKKSA